ncbi:MAG: hypothetical protein CMC56_05645 [Flavobacteriaceae bacterium]|jgi:hypothetical protein|nr:hypothetical protein [Flavobacteriaceae bacterium]|tara:strand:+ start:1735 stop:2139 length:405 start_codon:yes stop_codon:yes gene_type:complete
MKPTPFIKIISIVLAVVVLTAPFSLKVEQHFCKSKLADISAVSKKQSCCKSTDKHLSTNQKPCCSDLSFELDGLDLKQILTAHKETVLTVFAEVVSLQIPVNYGFATPKEYIYNHYNPPPLIFDIQSRDQVYRL